MQLLGTFYGFEQRTGANRLFKIYVTDQGLSGGWIAPCDIKMMSHFGGNRPSNQKITQVQECAQAWEDYLDSLVPGDEAFLAAHSDNFAFDSSFTQASLTWKLNLLERAATRFGALDVCLDGSKQRRFYLVGSRTPDEVAAMLSAAVPQLRLEGQPVAAQPFGALEGAGQS